MQFDPHNILVINFGQMGDVVLSLPALRAIRERFPSARITVAVGKAAAEITALSGYADATRGVDRVGLRDGNTLVSIGRIFKLVRDVRRSKFDLVIDLHSLSETNLLGFLSGAPHRLFSQRPNRSLDYLCNFKPRPPKFNQELHVVDRYLEVLKPLNIAVPTRTPILKTSPAADSYIEALLRKEKANVNSLLVGLFFGAGHECRRWPMEHFAQLADFLIRNHGVRIIVFAGPEERSLIPQARSIFPSSVIFFDKLTITQLASAQARLTLFISNDTGPVHIAAAVGSPVIAILDCPTPHRFIPVGDEHRVICGERIDEIPVDYVYKVANELLASNRTERILARSQS